VQELQSLLNAAPAGTLPPLAVDGIFGPKTLARVKEFQAQGTPKLVVDGIVGPKTWAKLSAAAVQPEGDKPPPVVISQIAARQGNVTGLPAVHRLAAGVSKPPAAPRWVVVSEQNAPWLAWAKQFQVWPFAALVEIPNGASVDHSAQKLMQAAKLAGAGGAILLSVGHGGAAETGVGGPTDEGFFDLAPSGFTVAGN
jgi:peptidoglycan hydrolase-like protein with peptidoglycan-binding domain